MDRDSLERVTEGLVDLLAVPEANVGQGRANREGDAEIVNDGRARLPRLSEKFIGSPVERVVWVENKVLRNEREALAVPDVRVVDLKTSNLNERSKVQANLTYGRKQEVVDGPSNVCADLR
jgi:hypothetical protein